MLQRLQLFVFPITGDSKQLQLAPAIMAQSEWLDSNQLRYVPNIVCEPLTLHSVLFTMDGRQTICDVGISISLSIAT